MTDDPRVEALLEELLDSGGTPEQVCRACPELLPQVRAAWQRLRAVEAEVGALFPEPATNEGAAPSLLPTSDLPRIHGYEVQSVLGRGGMGVVYKAWHLRLNRAVALKMLLAGPYARPEELERFLREAEVVAGLRHANIVQVHDVGDHEGRPYFTMEFVEGGSLARKLAGVPQPARSAAALVATIAEAIQVAHQHGIIHRDLKPANILLIPDGTPRITDFGLARRLQDSGGLTLSGAAVGTPSYMAPEQARGQKDAIGPGTDVYALGAILYELLTGRPPFRAETAAATLQQVVMEEPVAPSRLNPRTPRDLETICLKCLQKESPHRYASAAALADDLHRFARGEPIAARRLGSLKRVARWGRRRPTAAALSAALLAATLLALALVGSWLWVNGQGTATQRAAAEDLQEVTRLLQKSDTVGARAALERAKGRLGASAPAELQGRIDRAGGNLELMIRLDFIRLHRAANFGPKVANARSDEAYEAAFREAGLGQIDDPPDIVAERVRASDIRDALVAALDDWYKFAVETRRKKWLLDVARLADRDATGWRGRARDREAWKIKAVRDDLVATAPIAEQPVPLLLLLAWAVVDAGEDALPFLTRIQQARPGDFWVNLALGDALKLRNRPAEAIRYYQAALALRPDAPVVHNNLGAALAVSGRIEEGIAHYRQAIVLDPASGAPRLNLAVASATLASVGQVRHEEARDDIQQALRFYPDSALLLAHLGDSLDGLGQPVEALEQYRKALALDPNLVAAEKGLRTVAIRQGRWDEASAAWRKTFDANRPLDDAWDGYAEFCLFRDQQDEYGRARQVLLDHFGATAEPRLAERVGRACLLLPAPEEELRKAAALIDRALTADKSQYPAWAYAYFLFAKGLAEYRLEHLDSAIAFMKGEASGALGPAPRLVLSLAQHRLGRTREARQTLAAAILAFDWRASKADNREVWIYHILRREAERLIVPELQAFLQGEHQPRDNDERLALLAVCQFKDLRGAEAKLYAAAFASDPKLAEDLPTGNRYHAACAAAQAGSERSADGAKLSEEERLRWRKQALAWLRADLDVRVGKLASNSLANRAWVQQTLAQWLSDPDLTGLRDPAALERLPDNEREEWRKLWNDIKYLVDRVRSSK